MGTIDKILPILQARQADPTQALDRVTVVATKEPLKVVVDGPDGKKVEVQLYLVKLGDKYWLTNFQDDDGIFVRQDDSYKPTFEELLRAVSQKYLAPDAKIELEKGGEVGIGNLGNVVLRIGYKKEGEKDPVEDQIVVDGGQKDPAFTRARDLDKKVIVSVKPDKADPSQKRKGQEPHHVPNGGLSVKSGDTRGNPAQWVTNQPTSTKVENIPVQASDQDIQTIVRAAAQAHKDQLLPFIGDYNNDGVIDDKDLEAALNDPNADQDGDKIPDFMEMYDPWFRQLTDPSKDDRGIFSNGVDSDGDGVDNLTEMLEGKNPNDPSDNSVVSDVRTTTQKVTFQGLQLRHDGLSGLTTKGNITADAEYRINSDGTVSPTKQPQVTFDEDPDTQRFWQLKWGADAYARYSLYGDGKLTLGHKLGFHKWNREFSDDLGLDTMRPWRLDATLLSFQWQINPANLALFEVGGTLGTPISNFWLKLGAAHDFGKGWELEEAFKLYPWRKTDPTITDRITGQTHVDETTTRVFTTQGGVHQSTFTGSQDFTGLDLTNQGSIPHGDDVNFDLSLRLKKTWLLDDGAYLQAVLNPVLSRYNMFGAEWPMHLIAGFGGYNFGPSAVKFDLGAFGRYSAYDAFSSGKDTRHAGMFNPFLNFHIPSARLHILGQYWLLSQKEGGNSLTSNGGSATVKWDMLPWMSPYAKYQFDEHYQLIPELYPGFGGGPSNHMVLGGFEFRIPTGKPDHRLSADVYGGYGSESSALGGGKVAYDGRKGTTTFGASVGADYSHSNIADTSPADPEDATKLMAYGEDKVTARTLSKEAKAGIIDRLKLLAYIKDKIFTTDEMEEKIDPDDDGPEAEGYGHDEQFNKFKAYVEALDESYFDGLTLNEEDITGEALKQVQAFNALGAADKKLAVQGLFGIKHKGLLEVNDDADLEDGVKAGDVITTWMTALVMGKILEKEQAEILKTAALSMGYNPDKLEASEREAISKELKKVYFDEVDETIEHYAENIPTNIKLVEEAAKAWLALSVTKVNEAIDGAEQALKKVVYYTNDADETDDWHKGMLTDGTDVPKLILKFIKTKVKDLPTLIQLIQDLTGIEKVLEQYSKDERIVPIMQKIVKARVSAERLAAVWKSSMEIDSKITSTDQLIVSDVTVDAKPKFKELDQQVFGTWTSGRLEGGLIQLLGAYAADMGMSVDKISLPNGKGYTIEEFAQRVTVKDLWDLWKQKFEDTLRPYNVQNPEKSLKRLITEDKLATLFYTVVVLDGDGQLKQSFFDEADENKPISQLKGYSEETGLKLRAAAIYYSLMKKGTLFAEMPPQMSESLNAYLRYDFFRADLSQDPLSSNPADVNFFALVYAAEKESGHTLTDEEFSSVKWLVNNLAQVNYTGWDKQVRKLIEKTKGNKAAFKKGLVQLIKGFKAKAKPGAYVAFRGPNFDGAVLNIVIRYLEAQTK